MAAQGEQWQEGIDIELMEPEAQDGTTVQDTAMQVDHPPQPNSESVMAAAAVYDNPPLRRIPSPTLGESAPDNGESTATGLFDVREMFEALMGEMKMNRQRMGGNAREMRSELKTNAPDMQNKIDASAQIIRVKCSAWGSACRRGERQNGERDRHGTRRGDRVERECKRCVVRNGGG